MQGDINEERILSLSAPSARICDPYLRICMENRGLQELKRASSLVEAPNVDNKPKEEDLIQLFENITEIKERNKVILQAIETGYSQHMIAKVLGISQQAVYGVVKRSRK